MVRIQDLETFRRVVEHGKGYLLITDKSLRRQTFHDVRCGFIKEKNFMKKVIDNRSKNGEYFWCEDRSEAKQSGARPCHWCL